MKRRAFLGMVGSAAAWPLSASAQQRKIWRIGFVSGNARPEVLETSIVAGFPQGMRELGYVEGRDFVIEWRFAEARAERYDAIADEMATLNIDLTVNLKTAKAIGVEVPMALLLRADEVID